MRAVVVHCPRSGDHCGMGAWGQALECVIPGCILGHGQGGAGPWHLQLWPSQCTFQGPGTPAAPHQLPAMAWERVRGSAVSRLFPTFSEQPSSRLRSQAARTFSRAVGVFISGLMWQLTAGMRTASPPSSPPPQLLYALPGLGFLGIDGECGVPALERSLLVPSQVVGPS